MRSAVSQHRRTHSGGNVVTLHEPPNAAPTDLRKDSSWWAVGQMTDFFFFNQLFQTVNTGCVSKGQQVEMKARG